MGNIKSKKKPINDICPITFEKIEDGVTLSCRHQFSLFSIQFYCLKNLTINKKNICPVCQKNINKSDYKNIFKKWILFNLIYDNWEQFNVFILKEILYKFQRNFVFNINEHKIFVPTFKIDYVNQSVLITSPTLYNLKFKESKYFKSNININGTTNYGETIKNLELCIEGSLQNSQKYIEYFRLIYYILCNSNISNKKKLMKRLKKDKTKMKFYMSDINKITTIDTYDGDMKNNFILKSGRCYILFNIFFITVDKKTHIINNINSIWYF